MSALDGKVAIGPLFAEDRRQELSPENVAQGVGWLASPLSAPITGQIVSFGRRLPPLNGPRSRPRRQRTAFGATL